MSHLGLICPELSGHLNPMTTLGGELKRRGHRVTLVARPDARVKTESAGLEFLSIGERDFPAGSIARTDRAACQLGGLNAIRFTAELLRRAAVTILEDAPGVITGARIDALLVDQVTSAGDTVPEMLGLPFVTVCNALALNPDPAVPPAVTPWRYRRGWIWRVRNALGMRYFAGSPSRSCARSTHGVSGMICRGWRAVSRRARAWRKSRNSPRFLTILASVYRTVFTIPGRGTPSKGATL